MYVPISGIRNRPLSDSSNRVVSANTTLIHSFDGRYPSEHRNILAPNCFPRVSLRGHE